MFIKDNFISLLAFIAAAFFLTTAIIIHLIQSDLDFTTNTLSQYALGEYGIMLQAGFFAIGISQLLLAWLLLTNFSKPLMVAGGISLLLAGSGVIVVALFPVQPQHAALADRLPHILGATAQFLFFPIAALLLAHTMVASKMRGYTLFTGYFTAIMFAVVLALFLLRQNMAVPAFGLVEKLDIAAITLWILVASYILYRPSYLRGLFGLYRH